MSTPAPDTERVFPSWVLEQLAKQDVVQAVSDIMFGERQPLEDSLFSAAVSIDGKYRVPFAAWQLVLRQAVGVTIEASQRVLALHTSDPNWDRLRLRLAAHAADQLAETWRGITGFCGHMTDALELLRDADSEQIESLFRHVRNIYLEPGPLGIDVYVAAAARTIALAVLSIPAQGLLFGEQAGEPADPFATEAQRAAAHDMASVVLATPGEKMTEEILAEKLGTNRTTLYRWVVDRVARNKADFSSRDLIEVRLLKILGNIQVGH